MQLELEMSWHQLKVYTKFETDISKHVENKSWKLGRTDGRTDMTMTKISNGRDTCCISVCTQSEEKWLWHTFCCRTERPDCDLTLARCVMLPPGCTYQVSNWYLKNIYKNVRNFFAALLSSPFRAFLFTRGPKNVQPWQQSLGVKKLTI